MHKKIRSGLSFNTYSFYFYGFSSVRVSRNNYFSLESKINKQTWVIDKSGTYNHALETFVSNRNSYGDTLHRDSFDPCFFYEIEQIFSENTFKEITDIFDLELVNIDLWDGTENLGYHWDGHDDSDFIALMYFTDSELGLSDGGQIITAIRSADDNLSGDIYKCLNPKISESFMLNPKPRDLLILNNNNPYFVHKPIMVNGGVKRITLSMGLRFRKKENKGKFRFCVNKDITN